MKKVISIVGVTLFIIIDQLTKFFLAKDIVVIDGVLKFSNTHNMGVAFGMLPSNEFLIILVNIFILAMMARFIMIKNSYMSNKVYYGLLLIIAGGTSNVIDRIFRGYVQDFIDFTQIIQFPVFNLADVVVLIGWILLIIGVIKSFIDDAKKV